MTKYCTLPDREPVRIASLDGNIIIIGSTPRTIPEQFISDAKAAGCVTESELKAFQPVTNIYDPPEQNPIFTAKRSFAGKYVVQDASGKDVTEPMSKDDAETKAAELSKQG